MAQLDKLFDLVIREDASDLHVTAGSAPYLRVNGSLKKVEMQPLTHEQNLAMFNELMSDRVRAQFKQFRQADFVYNHEGKARFRSNVFMQRRGISGAFRLIPMKVLTAEQLQLPKVITGLCSLKKGLVLVTGPTGSGKSTTLAAMIDVVNATRSDHILTVEDPIEFIHPSKKCLLTQRQVGDHTESFSDALRAALREDPDVILVGEMRDLETIQLAITAAETGHLVFGTLHTSSAPKTVDRMIDAFPVNQQDQIRTMLADSLKGVIAQNLLRRASGKGRVAAMEILLGTPALANLIRENKTFQIPSLMQTQRNAGMQLMDQALMDLVRQRIVTPEEAASYAQDKRPFTPGGPAA